MSFAMRSAVRNIGADAGPVWRVSAMNKTKASSLRAADDAYLSAVGERVRNARALRGISRKTLARDSGVSERYLASLESGSGNVSILRLRQVAQAMGTV